MNILITKKLSSSTLDLIQSWGWQFDIMEALNISKVEVSALPLKPDAWIISSRNSWHAVQKFITETPQSIYCVGQSLLDELNKSGVNSKMKSFEGMETLAHHLKDQGFKTVLYFCGDNHRGELDQILEGSGTSVIKVTTHESKMTFPVLAKQYDTVLVFSPRSAESLLKNNSFSAQTVFACIGKTTEKYLREKGITNTFCASRPDAELLLNEFHDWCLTHTNN